MSLFASTQRSITVIKAKTKEVSGKDPAGDFHTAWANSAELLKAAHAVDDAVTGGDNSGVDTAAKNFRTKAKLYTTHLLAEATKEYGFKAPKLVAQIKTVQTVMAKDVKEETAAFNLSESEEESQGNDQAKPRTGITLGQVRGNAPNANPDASPNANPVAPTNDNAPDGKPQVPTRPGNLPPDGQGRARAVATNINSRAAANTNAQDGKPPVPNRPASTPTNNNAPNNNAPDNKPPVPNRPGNLPDTQGRARSGVSTVNPEHLMEFSAYVDLRERGLRVSEAFRDQATAALNTAKANLAQGPATLQANQNLLASVQAAELQTKDPAGDMMKGREDFKSPNKDTLFNKAIDSKGEVAALAQRSKTAFEAGMAAGVAARNARQELVQLVNQQSLEAEKANSGNLDLPQRLALAQELAKSVGELTKAQAKKVGRLASGNWTTIEGRATEGNQTYCDFALTTMENDFDSLPDLSSQIKLLKDRMKLVASRPTTSKEVIELVQPPNGILTTMTYDIDKATARRAEFNTLKATVADLLAKAPALT